MNAFRSLLSRQVTALRLLPQIATARCVGRFSQRVAPNRCHVADDRVHPRRGLCVRFAIGFGAILFAGAALAQTYVYKSQFGTLGSGNGQFNGAEGVAIDPTSRHIVVTDENNARVQIFDSAGNYLSQFGSAGTGNGQFSDPFGVAIDPTTHNIVVTDLVADRVQIFDSAGTYLSQFGAPGTADGQFVNPAGVAIDPTSHNIIVVETNNRVQIFDSAGAFLSAFGSMGSGNGQFLDSTDVAIDPTSHHIVVTDGSNNRVQIFDSAGNYLSQFGSAGSGNGQFSIPFGVAIDPTSHNIVVVDEFNGRVQVFDSAGTYVSQFGSAGTGDGQFGEPRRAAIDPASRDIAVTDASILARVQIFAIEVAPAPVFQAAASRRVHGAAGTFDLPLSLTSTNPSTEPRQGPSQSIVFTFDKPINGATVAVTEGTATAAAPTFSGNDVVVGLTGVSNQQYVTVSLKSVTSTDGGIGGSGSVRVGFLTGDVNQTRVVSIADLGLINAQLAQPVTAANFVKDVNASGTLTLADKGIANANLTKALPLP